MTENPYTGISNQLIEFYDSVDDKIGWKLASYSAYNPTIVSRAITEFTGAWEIEFKTTNPNGQFIYAFLSGDSYLGQGDWENAYSIEYLSATGKIQLKVTTDTDADGWGTGGTVLIETDATSVSDIHKVKVTRDADGNFEMFYNDVSVGTVTDTTYTTFTKEGLSAMSGGTYNYQTLVFDIKKDSNYILDKIFLTGTGTSEDPFIIYNFAGLELVGTSPYTLDKYYQLGNDIDASPTSDSGYNSGAGWLPLATFSGNFDGNNHKITGLYINRPSTANQGFIGVLNGTIKNLTLKDGSIHGYDYTGAFAGSTNVAAGVYTIQNCINDNTSVTGRYYVSGIVAGSSVQNEGSATITECSCNATLVGSGTVGGIVGTERRSMALSDCSFSGSLTSSSYANGGIVGMKTYGTDTISGCTVTGTFSVNTRTNVGGIIGECYNNNMTISDCIVTTNISSSANYLGGIVAGQSSASSGTLTITKCKFIGNLTGANYVGGILGYSNGPNGSINECYTEGVLQSTGNYSGGLCGWNKYAINNCMSSMTVNGDLNAGGLVGDQYNSAITNSYARGAVTGVTNVGGLTGTHENSASAVSSYWDTETSGRSNSSLGEGKTTSEMKTKLTYTSWRFGVIWYIESDINSGYPTIVPKPITGTGTSEDPFIISNFPNLELIGTGVYTLGSYYQLGDDIDASITSDPGYGDGSGFLPIGTVATPFNGNFDGNNKTISNLFIDRGVLDYVGLFGYVFNCNTIKDLTVEGNITGRDRVGGIAGTFQNNVWSNGTWYLSNISFNGDIHGRSYVGGLFGNLEVDVAVLLVSDLSMTGTIEAYSTYVGGISGQFYANTGYGNDRLQVTNTIVEDLTITAPSSNTVGGVVGIQVGGQRVIGANLSNISITGHTNVGGFVGEAHRCNIIQNINIDGDIIGNNNVGGILGYGEDQAGYGGIIFSECTIKGSVNGTDNSIGGVAGKADGTYGPSVYLEEIHVDGSELEINTLSTTDYVGGICGIQNGASVKNCSIVNMYLRGRDYIGGISGGMYRFGMARNTFFEGIISGRNYLGGFTGATDGQGYAQVYLHQCFTTGSVSVLGTGNYVGGLVGYCQHFEMLDCYSRASVQGGDYVGGLVGHQVSGHNSSANMIQRSYSIGLVSASGTHVGGVIGTIDDPFESTDVFWDTETSEQALSPVGVPLTTEEMKIKTNFVNFDFTVAPVWDIDNKNDGFPFLKDTNDIDEPLLLFNTNFSDLLLSTHLTLNPQDGHPLSDAWGNNQAVLDTVNENLKLNVTGGNNSGSLKISGLDISDGFNVSYKVNSTSEVFWFVFNRTSDNHYDVLYWDGSDTLRLFQTTNQNWNGLKATSHDVTMVGDVNISYDGNTLIASVDDVPVLTYTLGEPMLSNDLYILGGGDSESVIDNLRVEQYSEPELPYGTIFEDDFSAEGLDGDKWLPNEEGSITASILNGKYHITDAGKNWIYTGNDIGNQTKAKLDLPTNCNIEYDVAISDTVTEQMGEVGLGIVQNDGTMMLFAGQGDDEGGTLRSKEFVFSEQILSNVGNSWTVANETPNRLSQELLLIGQVVHYKIEKRGNNYRIFSDGIKVADTTLTSTLGGLSIMVGAYPDYPFLGYGNVDNILVTSDTVTPPAEVPVADFSADVTSGTAPLMVTFTDESTNTPTSWEWDFGDESELSTDQNPVHQYNSGGTFTVTLIATNASGEDTEEKTDYMVVAPHVEPPTTVVESKISSRGWNASKGKGWI